MFTLVKLPSKLAWFPIIALSKLAFFMCECDLYQTIFYRSIYHMTTFPKDTLGPCSID
jgi:hypothetical protein